MQENILFFLLFLPAALLAQITSGTVEYDVTTKFEITEADGIDPALLAQMPTSNTAAFQLHFLPEASLYKSAPVKEESETFTEDGGNRVMIRMGGSDNARYTNIKEGTYTEQNNFLGREFLIQDQQPDYKWKLVDEQKTVLGLPVKKAILQDTSQVVIAWYSSAIAVSTGPEGYSGLPGLIMELSLNDGNRQYIATKFNPQSEVKELIVAPTKGKKVNQKEMDAIREKKLKEMNSGGGGAVIKVIRQ